MMTSSSSSSPETSGETSQNHFSYKNATHDEVLEDLSSRFILNLPEDELSSLERICFQVEQAHWFYEDFIREENPKFPSLPLKKFSAMLFHACPLLHQWSHDHEQAFNTFMQYKTRVPVCGAIMLNDTWDKCLLVKGWKSSSGWGFPKGKINEVEPPASCAIREVLEETGYNLTDQIDSRHVIEMTIKEQKISLFIVSGIPENFPFKTKTRKEISKIEWFHLTDLPTWRRNKSAAGKFYLISPFIGPLKAYINEHKPRYIKKAVEAQRARPQREHAVAIATPFPKETNSSSTPVEQLSTASAGYHASPGSDDPSPKQITTTMDPHFAHLLSALAMSASLKEEELSKDMLYSNLGEHPRNGKMEPVASSFAPAPPPNIHSTIKPKFDLISSSSAPLQGSVDVVTQLSSSTPLTPSLSSVQANNTKSPAPPSTLGSSTPAPVIQHTSSSVSSPTSTKEMRSFTSPPVQTDKTQQHIALLEAVSAESARLMQAYRNAATVGMPANLTEDLSSPMLSRSLGRQMPLPAPMNISSSFQHLPVNNTLPSTGVLYSFDSQSSNARDASTEAASSHVYAQPKTNLQHNHGPPHTNTTNNTHYSVEPVAALSPLYTPTWPQSLLSSLSRCSPVPQRPFAPVHPARSIQQSISFIPNFNPRLSSNNTLLSILTGRSTSPASNTLTNTTQRINQQ